MRRPACRGHLDARYTRQAAPGARASATRERVIGSESEAAGFAEADEARRDGVEELDGREAASRQSAFACTRGARPGGGARQQHGAHDWQLADDGRQAPTGLQLSE